MRHLAVLLLFFLLAPFSAEAASLYLSPSSLSLSAGQTGTFSIYVESAGQAMNAVSGTISVDSGVTVGGVSKAGSIISFWAAEPSVAGTIVSFEGVVLNGYTGAAGKILSFTVRAQTAGTYSARFSSGTVLANDGEGTNITSGTRGGTLTVTALAAPTPAEEPEESDSSKTPAAPIVTSTEFPNEDKWYTKSTGTFSWEVPTGVTAVRTLLDQNSDSTPSILLDGRTTSRTVSDIPEGVNYFHVQFKNAEGWGDIAHVRVAVDITPPSFTALNEEVRDDSTAPRIGVTPEADDEVSGLSGFEVSVNDGKYTALSLSTGGTYFTDPLPPGTHTLRVRAVDEAGNVSAIRTFSVTVEPIGGPSILSVTNDLRVGMPVTVTGTAPVPGTYVHVVFGHEIQGQTASSRVSEDGTFTVTLAGGLERGTYHLGAFVEDERGARSLTVDGGKVVVHGPPLDATVLLLAQILGAIAVLLAIIGGAIWLFLVLGIRIARKRSELLVELREADTITRKAFTLLRKDVAGYAAYLKRLKRTRPLSPEEQEFIESISEDLVGSERIIRKEIADAAAEAHKAPRKRKTVDDL